MIFGGEAAKNSFSRKFCRPKADKIFWNFKTQIFGGFAANNLQDMYFGWPKADQSISYRL